jgi:predicted ester cyclase
LTPREVAEGYLGSFAGADPDDIASRVTVDFVNEHVAAIGRGCAGRDAYRDRLPGFLASFTGLRYDIEEIVVDGHRVVAAYVMRARWQGETAIDVRGVQRLVVRDGLVARRVDYWDSLVFLLQVEPSLRDTMAAWL